MTYRNYRGRGSKGKAVLAVVLILVIIAAVGVMFLQEHVIYDADGMPHLQIPGMMAEKPEPDDDIQVELTIDEPEPVTTDMAAFSIPEGVLTVETVETQMMQHLLSSAELSYSAVEATLKNADGTIFFDSAAAVSGSVSIGADTAAALEKLAGGDSSYHAIARISCFHDPKAANRDIDGMGLKNTGGYIFYDGNNSQWIDPAKPDARQYLCALAKEAAELGFDEILLTDVSYPTVGKLDKIAYGENTKNANLTAFLTEMREALEPYSVALSIELPEEVIRTGADEAAGQVLAEIAPLVDGIYTRTTPVETEELAAAVTAVDADLRFVPELITQSDLVQGNWLLLSK